MDYAVNGHHTVDFLILYVYSKQGLMFGPSQVWLQLYIVWILAVVVDILGVY